MSNTVYLEQEFGWTGLLIEANPKYRQSLSGRKAVAVQAAVTAERRTYEFRDAGLYGGVEEHLDRRHRHFTNSSNVIQVQGKPLEDILSESGAPALIDYISIDVEGAELPIVEQLSKTRKFRFRCGTIEHNFRLHELNKMKGILADAGYEAVWVDNTGHDLFFIDKTTP